MHTVDCFLLCLKRDGNKGALNLDNQGRTGITSFVRWNLRPVKFGVEVFGLECPGGHQKRYCQRTIARKTPATSFLWDGDWVHASGVVRQHSVLGRVLRRFWEGFWGRVLGKGSQKGSEKGACYGFTAKKGSEKGVSRRCLERPLGEYDPLGVRPRGVGEELTKS